MARHPTPELTPQPAPTARPSPNIWRWPAIYEVENRAQDVDGELWRALEDIVGAAALSADVVDVGCGDGFHLPMFAARARTVIGVEPHPPLLTRARERTADVANARVLAGHAQQLPLPDVAADLVHARTAYFFGPGCEPGIAEAERVLRPGGVLAIVDLDASMGPYGEWLRADLPRYQPEAVEEFFATAGFELRRVRTVWRFPTRQALEAVLRIEFSPSGAARAAAATTGLTIPVWYRIHVRHKPTGLVYGTMRRS